MGHWSDTTFVRLPHPRAAEGVFQCLRALFAVDGYEPLESIPTISPEESEQMQYAGGVESPLWAAAFIPGKRDWHVIKCAPFELMIDRAKGMLSFRLAHLTMLLRCHAMAIHIFDDSCAFLAETDPTGTCLTFGGSCDEAEYDVPDITEYAVARDESRRKMRPFADPRAPFVLGPEYNQLVQQFREPYYHNEAAHLAQLCGLQDDEWDNTIQVEYLNQGKPIPVQGAVSWYFRRAAIPPVPS